jgi:hypothetical protein
MLGQPLPPPVTSFYLILKMFYLLQSPKVYLTKKNDDTAMDCSRAARLRLEGGEENSAGSRNWKCPALFIEALFIELSCSNRLDGYGFL